MNTFGKNFRISIFGESHGESVGIIIDGCPSGIEISADEINADIERRKPSVSGTTERKETDEAFIRSGIFKGITTGTPIMIEFLNSNKQSGDYEKYRSVPRPGHVDFAASKKYLGFEDYRGSGHFSGRLTLPLVAAGTIAKKILKNVRFSSEIIEIGGQKDWTDILKETFSENDSLGGIIECRISGLTAGMGEPFFDSVESVISHLVFSIPSIKGIEFGKGFGSSRMKGSEYNDSLNDISGVTGSNNCGGITGGLSNGNDIVFRVSFRPPSSIGRKQTALNIKTGNKEEIEIKGRHDTCPVLRSRVIVEAAAAIATCDILMT